MRRRDDDDRDFQIKFTLILKLQLIMFTEPPNVLVFL